MEKESSRHLWQISDLRFSRQVKQRCKLKNCERSWYSMVHRWKIHFTHAFVAIHVSITGLLKTLQPYKKTLKNLKGAIHLTTNSKRDTYPCMPQCVVSNWLEKHTMNMKKHTHNWRNIHPSLKSCIVDLEPHAGHAKRRTSSFAREKICESHGKSILWSAYTLKEFPKICKVVMKYKWRNLDSNSCAEENPKSILCKWKAI